MAEESEKTEDATPKKKEDARQKGQVAQSRDVSTVILLAAATLALSSSLGGRLGRLLLEGGQQAWSGMLTRPSNVADYHALFLAYGAIMASAMAPFALIFVVVAAASNVAQIGFMLSAEALAFKIEKLNPISGLKRILSVDKLYELGKAIVRLGVVVAILLWVLSPAMPQVFGLLDSSVVDIGAFGGQILKKAIWVILAVFGIFAAADFFWQRFQHEKRLRMTKQEVRDESKSRDGDPQVKSRIRQIQREAAQSRMFDSVADADVVIMNPTHFAVALQYRPPEQTAPKVLAKGRNHLALRIRGRAEELGIPVVENPPVAQLLYKTAKIDREIPDDLYNAVAEILAYVYRLSPRRSSQWRSTG